MRMLTADEAPPPGACAGADDDSRNFLSIICYQRSQRDESISKIRTLMHRTGLLEASKTVYFDVYCRMRRFWTPEVSSESRAKPSQDLRGHQHEGYVQRTVSGPS